MSTIFQPDSRLTPGRMPAIFLGHGAPPLVDDPVWPVQLSAWSAQLPKPKAILVVSAHWEEAPVTIGATPPVPLVYDFWGFPEMSTLTRFGDGASPSAATSSHRPSSVHSIAAS
jgi:4,5-DOPA dioxygenase extradiol